VELRKRRRVLQVSQDPTPFQLLKIKVRVQPEKQEKIDQIESLTDRLILIVFAKDLT
jgi:hypothetical protein